MDSGLTEHLSRLLLNKEERPMGYYLKFDFFPSLFKRGAQRAGCSTLINDLRSSLPLPQNYY